MPKSDLFPRYSSAILDANILMQLARGKRAEAYRPIFEFLVKNGHEIFLLDASKFELVGFAGNKTDYDYLSNWISQFTILSARREDVEAAIVLSSFYKLLDPSLNVKQISFCDCLYAAQLVRYKENIFLVTADIYDFSISIFDIKHIEIIEDNRRATIVAFVSYNDEKWKSAQSKFSESARTIRNANI